MKDTDAQAAVKPQASPSDVTEQDPVGTAAEGIGNPQEAISTLGNDGGANSKVKVPVKLTPALFTAKSKPVPTVDPEVVNAWHESAMTLASWASEHLVNNIAGYGGYWIDECSTVHQTTHKRPLDLDRLVRHFQAMTSNDLIGLHSLIRGEDGVCRSLWTGIDIDRHDDEVEAAATLKLALAVHDRAKAAGFTPLLSQSDGKGGYHVLVLHAEPIESWLARAFGLWLVHDGELLGVVGEPEVFPKQEEIGPNGWGNWLRLFGHHHKRSHFSRFWDGSTWLEGRAAIDFILGVTGSPADLIPNDVMAMLAAEEAAKAALATYGKVEHDLGKDGNGKAWGSVAEGLDDLKPGDDFNARHDWDDVIVPHGWSIFKTEGEVIYWARPGVTDHHGATTNHEGSGLLFVFTNATDFLEQKSYTKFGAYAVLEHAGDHTAAAKHLVTLGYGSSGQKAKEKAAFAAGIGLPADPDTAGPVDAELAEMKLVAERRARRKPPSCARRTQVTFPGNGSASTPPQKDQDKPPAPKSPGATNGHVAKAPAAKAKPAALSKEEMGIVPLEGLTPTSIEWLWPDRFALGKYNLLASVGGEGKTQFAIRLVAMVTRGEAFPDGSGTAPVGTCLFLSSDDGLQDTIVPRLIAAGAEMGRCHGLTAKLTVKVDGKEHVNLMSFQDLKYWGDVFDLTKPVLMVVDPIPAFLGRGINDHHNNEVRAVLEPFCALLDEKRVSLLAITHLGKSVDQKTPIAKILGSVAYANVARTVSVVFRDPQDEERRLLCPLKNNFSPPQEALAYRIEGCEIEAGGKVIKTSRVAIEAGTVDVDAFELMAAQGRSRGPQPKRYMEMAAWLYDRLRPVPGSVVLGNIVEEAGAKGFLGKLNKAGKRWSNFRLLYRGAEYVPKLAAPRDGHQVVQYVIDQQGKKHKRLRLIAIGSVPPPVPGTTPDQVTVEIVG